MEKLGIKVINNDNLLKSVNLRKSSEIHINTNKPSFNEEEKQSKIIRYSSLCKRKKFNIINKKEYMSSSYEKRTIKKEQVKKEDLGTNKTIKIKKYHEKKEVSKKIKKEKDKEKDIHILNIATKKRISTNNNNDISNKQKVIKKLKSNENNEIKKVNFKKNKAEKFVNINKDNSMSKKNPEFKTKLKPKSDKKYKEVYFSDIKNDDEELSKGIDDVFKNNQNNKSKNKNKKIKYKIKNKPKNQNQNLPKVKIHFIQIKVKKKKLQKNIK
jgi:hypothetical protein